MNRASEAGPSTRALAALLATAALVRALTAGALWRSEPLTRELVSDAAYYDAWARAWAAGAGFRDGLPHWLPPLYPAWLSLLHRLGLGELPWVLLFQGALGLLATWLIVRIAAGAAGARAGLAAGWLWTFYAAVLLHETRLLGVHLALPLALAGLLAAQAFWRRLGEHEPRRAFAPALLCGLCLGLAALAHPNLLLVPVALGAAALVRVGAQRALLPAALGLALGMCLGLLPGPLSNLTRSGQPILVSANGGLNFWFANNPAARGTFHAPGPEWAGIGDQRDVSLALAAKALGEEVDERRASRYWSARGWAWIAAEPAAASALWARKLAAALSSHELDVQVSLAAARHAAPALWIAPLPFGLLLALAALGWRAPVRERGLFAAWIAAGLVATLLYFHYPRFRLVWAPALLPFAGAGALALFDALKRRAPWPPASALVAAALLAALSFAPFEGDYPSRLEAHALTDQARAWRAKGEAERARRSLERALEAWPESPRALLELGRLERDAARGRDPMAGSARIRRAADLAPEWPEAVFEAAAAELARLDRTERALGLGRLEFWLDHHPHHPERGRLSLLAASGWLDQVRMGLGGPAELERARLRLEEATPGEARDMLRAALAEQAR